MARTFAEALNELLDDGLTVRELAKRLHDLRPTQSLENWRRAIRRWLKGTEPVESTITLVAEAAGVAREVFPAAVSPRRTSDAVAVLRERLLVLDDRMADLEGALQELADQLRDHLEDPPDVQGGGGVA